MIFRPELAQLVLDGKKTQTRRPVREPECRYKVGKTYAVQPGRGKAALGRIYVESVERAQLGEIGGGDAIREGFPTREDLFEYWRGLYGTLDLAQRVDIITFRLETA